MNYLSLFAAALGFGVFVAPLAATAAYPERPIRFIVPAAAGNSGDISARIIVAQLTRQLRQQIVVDNRSGASGSIAMDIIAKAPPDGYTIGTGNLLTVAINRSVLPKLPYDPAKLQAVVHYTTVPILLGVTLSLPVKSVQELIDHARANPGKLLFASSGNATTTHVSAELFKMMTGTSMVHVPFKGSVVALADLTAGRVNLMFDNIPSIGPHVRAGKLRGLAVTSAKRVPAPAETPAETPAPLIGRIRGEIHQVVQRPDIKERLLRNGIEPAGSTPEERAALLKTEIARWRQFFKARNVRAE